MSKKFQTAYVTPWCSMMAESEIVPRIFNCESLEPFAERDSITFFNNRKEEKRLDKSKTGYDRLYDKSPYDPKKPRCDRTQINLIWAEIYDENRKHEVATITSHSYGRSNRVQIDFPESTFYRSKKIQDNFYSRNNVNLTPELDRPCHS